MQMEERTKVRWRDGLPEIRTAHLVLRIARPDEAKKLHRYALRNKERLEPWEIARPVDYYRPQYWNSAADEDQSYARRRSGARFRVYLDDDDSEVIAVVGVRDVMYGEVMSAQIGYSVDGAYEGRGVMLEASAAALDFAFDELHLHRMEACCMPSNVRSQSLLKKLGFSQEGTLRQSLRISGKWEDHLIWSVLSHEWDSVRSKYPTQ